MFVIIGHVDRSNSVVRAFAHGAMGRRIDLSWGSVQFSSLFALSFTTHQLNIIT